MLLAARLLLAAGCEGRADARTGNGESNTGAGADTPDRRPAGRVDDPPP